ncbi:MAG: YceI family protein, partial [Bacteroidia bacterium]|nr:YceI family protein [Bacteroidia bacterium]
AQTYVIDAGHSSVQINVERFGVVDVVGRFKAVDGTITYNPDDGSATAAQATIKVDSYDANNKGGEEAVKSAVFLDAAKYPEITFTSKEAITKNDREYLVGDLTIHGVTNEIELPFTINGPLLDLPTQKQSIAFEASITIDRQDYGITFDRALPNGTLLVANDIDITLTILAIAQ